MRRSRKRKQGNRSPPNPEQTLLTDWTGGNVVPAGAGVVARSAQAGRDEVEPVHQGKMCPARRTPALRSVTSGGRVSGQRVRSRVHQSADTRPPPDDMDEHSGRCGPRTRFAPEAIRMVLKHRLSASWTGTPKAAKEGRAQGWALSIIAPHGRGQPSNLHSGPTLGPFFLAFWAGKS